MTQLSAFLIRIERTPSGNSSKRQSKLLLNKIWPLFIIKRKDVILYDKIQIFQFFYKTKTLQKIEKCNNKRIHVYQWVLAIIVELGLIITLFWYIIYEHIFTIFWLVKVIRWHSFAFGTLSANILMKLSISIMCFIYIHFSAFATQNHFDFYSYTPSPCFSIKILISLAASVLWCNRYDCFLHSLHNSLNIHVLRNTH